MNRKKNNPPNYFESSEGSESDDENELKKVSDTKKNPSINSDSSEESDIEKYLLNPEKLDLDSEFFTTKCNDGKQFENNFVDPGKSELQKVNAGDVMEKNKNQKIVKPLQKLSGLKAFEEGNACVSLAKATFNQLQKYTTTIEEAKNRVAKFRSKDNHEENKSDIINLLETGERIDVDHRTKVELQSSDFESCDSDTYEFEEVKEKEQNIIPTKNIQVIVDMPDNVKKKKGIDLMAALKRRLNRIRRDNQVLVHKVHLLCWIAHGNFLNAVVNETEILATALSLLPSQNCYPVHRTDLSYLEKIVSWYKKTITLTEKSIDTDRSLSECLKEQMKSKQFYSRKLFTLIFVAVLRSLGIQTRIVMSIQVEPLRPPMSELHSFSSTKPKNTTSDDTKQQSQKRLPSLEHSQFARTTQGPCSEKVEQSSVSGNQKKKSISENENTRLNRSETSNEATKGTKIDGSSQGRRSNRIIERMKTEQKNCSDRREKRNQSSEIIESQDSQNSKATVTQRKVKVSKRKNSIPMNDDTDMPAKRSKSNIDQSDGIDGNDFDNNLKMQQLGTASKIKGKSKKKCVTKNYHEKASNKKTEPKSDDEYEPQESFYNRLKDTGPSIKKWNKVKNVMEASVNNDDVKGEVIKIIKKRIKQEKHSDKRLSLSSRAALDSDSDSDYISRPIQKKHQDSVDEFIPQTKTKRRIPVHPVLSDDEKLKKPKKGNDIWVEVFLEAEEKWISVDVIFGLVHCIEKIIQRATSPISYVLSWDNNNSIKDVTQRYCPNFNTTTRKLRVDPKWWSETLQPFMAFPTNRDEQENDDLSRKQLDQPLPKTISEFKNHPLYALKRHLLKFEAIYPPEPAILGYIRGEAVYPRSCVYILRSRDIWLKQAKVVKVGEQPYKTVKARPKWDKLSNKMISNKALEVFGLWQVQDYDPPTAVNGIVPRNAFGNVDLFKPCMLPKGCVHLKLPGLNKVCKSLNIDYASAIVGFDFHGGSSHPVYDGFVVCQENEGQVVAAWEFEQKMIEKKEQERIDKRVFGNWKKLIKGLLIRERLKAKYDFGEPSTSSSNEKKKLKYQ